MGNKRYLSKYQKKSADDNDDIDFTQGESYLNKYLRNLFLTQKISSNLYDLLKYMLAFDPLMRSDCAQIYTHKWFDDVRHLWARVCFDETVFLMICKNDK